MDSELRKSMLDYYNERAEEYEEAFTLGTGTASIADHNLFKSEAVTLSKVVKGFAHGILIDIACGTGYWLSHYASQCSSITRSLSPTLCVGNLVLGFQGGAKHPLGQGRG